MLLVEGLSRSFGTTEVLRDLDLRLGAGERVALWGPNGSGKSTLLRCLAGVLAPSSGRVLIDGNPAGSVEARRSSGVWLSQDRSFYLRLTGHRNLLFFAGLRYGRREAAHRVAEIEEELQLGGIAARRADSCSTGMLQQLGLARALLGDPSLLVLDEPTRSLDEGALERFWAALDRRRARHALVLATHREDDSDRCGARVELSA